MIMEANGLLINNDAFVFEEIKQVRERDLYKKPTFSETIAEVINSFRYSRGQKLVEADQVYRLMSQEEGWLKKRNRPFSLYKKKKLLAEIKEVLADYQKAGFKVVTVVMITAEINYRRLQNSHYLDESSENLESLESLENLESSESLKTVNQDNVYRIIHEAGFFEERLSVKNEEELTLDEVIRGLEKNPDNDYEMLMIGFNNSRSADEQRSEGYIHGLMNKTGLMTQEAQPIATIEYNRIYQEIIERLTHNPEASYFRVAAEFNLAYSYSAMEPVSDKPIEGLIIRTDILPVTAIEEAPPVEMMDISTTVTEEAPPVEMADIPTTVTEEALPVEMMDIPTAAIEEAPPVEMADIPTTVIEETPRERRRLTNDERKWLLNRILELRKQKKYSVARLTVIINSTLDESQQFTETQVKNITQKHNFSGKGRRLTDNEKRWLLNRILEVKAQHKDYNTTQVTRLINSTLDESQQFTTNQIKKIMYQYNIPRGSTGGNINREEDAEILEAIRQIIYKNPDYSPWDITKEISKIRLAQKKPKVSERRISRIMMDAGLLSPEIYYVRWGKNKNKKTTTAVAGGVGLIAAAGAMEQGYARDHITEETRAPETSTAETNLLMGENEFTGEITPYMEEMAPEITEEMISEIVEGIAEITADAALDWIPWVGAGKAAFEVVIGRHPATGRELPLFERLLSGGFAILNVATFGGSGVLKQLKHSKFAFQQSDHLKALSKMNGEQFNKLASLVIEGNLKQAKEFFVSFLRSTGDIKRKAKPTRSRRKVVAEGGGSFTDEVAETTIIDPDVFQMKPGQIQKPINFNEMTDPRHGRVFIQTPDGNKIPLILMILKSQNC